MLKSEAGQSACSGIGAVYSAVTPTAKAVSLASMGRREMPTLMPDRLSALSIAARTRTRRLTDENV